MVVLYIRYLSYTPLGVVGVEEEAEVDPTSFLNKCFNR